MYNESSTIERVVLLTAVSTLLARFPRPSIPAHYRDACLFLLLAVLFGSGFVAIKTGLRELPPVLFASLRFDIAAIALLAYVTLTRPKAMWLPRTLDDLAGIGVAGLFLVALNNGLLFLGQETTTPAMASVMYGLNPVLAPVFAWWLLGDQISRIGALGIGIALSGVVIIVQPSPAAGTAASSLGQLLILSAAVAVALGSVLLQRLSPRMNTVPLTAWAMAAGAVMLHGVSLAAGESVASVGGVGPSTVASLLVLAIPGTAVAYAIQFGLLDRVGPVRTNLVAYVIPIFAALVGWLLLGAAVSRWTAIGFLVVVTGFAVVERTTIRDELRRLQGQERDPEPTSSPAPPCDD